MLEKNSARSTRLTQLLAFVFAVTASAALGACRDTSTAQGIVGPSASQSKDGNQADVADDDSNDHTTYEQVEFLGNPLVSEVTIVKANHDRYNRTQPYNSAEFGPQSLAFINAFRSNASGVANALGGVLYPDMLIVESSRNPNSSGWLSWALANGWGGRNLKDDVVDAGLSAIFGKVISPIGAYCDNGQLPLCTDNVNANDKPFLGSFPYLASPTL